MLSTNNMYMYKCRHLYGQCFCDCEMISRKAAQLQAFCMRALSDVVVCSRFEQICGKFFWGCSCLHEKKLCACWRLLVWQCLAWSFVVLGQIWCMSTIGADFPRAMVATSWGGKVLIRHCSVRNWTQLQFLSMSYDIKLVFFAENYIYS